MQGMQENSQGEEWIPRKEGKGTKHLCHGWKLYPYELQQSRAR